MTFTAAVLCHSRVSEIGDMTTVCGLRRRAFEPWPDSSLCASVLSSVVMEIQGTQSHWMRCREHNFLQPQGTFFRRSVSYHFSDHLLGSFQNPVVCKDPFQILSLFNITAYVYNYSAWEVEVERLSGVRGYPGLDSELQTSLRYKESQSN